MNLAVDLARVAEETNFSGALSISTEGTRTAELARGLTSRAHEAPISIDTSFGTASGTKGFTALAVASLIQTGHLGYDTTLRSLLGDELPLVDPRVTIRHLLSHTSGVGDYLDEDQLDDIDDEILTVPAQRLIDPRSYVPIIDGHPQLAPPGTEFSYNNGGYVMLALAIEAASSETYYEVLSQRVFSPAGMDSTSFPRSDDLPPGAATGYLTDGRTNVFHLPVRGVGDGGCYTTVGDMDRFWTALVGGQIVSHEVLEDMTALHNTARQDNLGYGLGFWLRTDRPTVMLEGMDAGVSFGSGHDHRSGVTYTVIANTSTGAWPLLRLIDEFLS